VARSAGGHDAYPLWRMIATGRTGAPLHVIAALLIVAGLAISAPPSCWCVPGDHFGLLLHPLVPHAHGAAHGPDLPGDEGASAGSPTDVMTADQAPGISAPTSVLGAHDALAGLLLPVVLAASVLGVSRRARIADLQPEQRALAPPIPPPRLVLLVA
jgi:hypothetical protein